MSTKIKSISFKKEKTIIGFVESYQPRDSNQVANEKTPGVHIDLPRHADFERAMDKLKPHLVIATGFAEPKDENGNILQKSHFDDYFADTDEAPFAFKGLDVTGIIIQGKNLSDGVQLLGTKTTDNGDVIPFKTGPIALKKSDEYNYPLMAILDVQIDILLSEAELYRTRKKHGAGVQQEIELPAPIKKESTAKVLQEA